MPAPPSTPRALRYAAVGAVLGLAAPLGLLVLRLLSPRRRASHRGWLNAELSTDAQTYLYVTSTTAVFASFGFLLGRREEALVAAHAEVRRLHEELSAIVAHDLRGPISALRMQSELLLEKAEAGEIRAPVAAIERIRRATTDLMRLAEDLLDAGRIETGRLRIDASPLSIADAARDLLERLGPALRQHPIELTCAPAPQALVDPSRFDQILTNLVDNACKYSPAQSPVQVVVEPSRSGVLLSVRDEGMGIAPQDLPWLFDRFFQTRRARAKKSGLGLGLYITKGLVEAHGGRIEVESVVDRGSTFRVWLPAAIAE
jgi:signal transduction histidine kinase